MQQKKKIERSKRNMWSGQTYQLVLEEARTGEHVSASCVKPILPNSPWPQNPRPNRLKIFRLQPPAFFSELQKAHTCSTASSFTFGKKLTLPFATLFEISNGLSLKPPTLHHNIAHQPLKIVLFLLPLFHPLQTYLTYLGC